MGATRKGGALDGDRRREREKVKAPHGRSRLHPIIEAPGETNASSGLEHSDFPDRYGRYVELPPARVRLNLVDGVSRKMVAASCHGPQPDVRIKNERGILSLRH